MVEKMLRAYQAELSIIDHDLDLVYTMIDGKEPINNLI